MIRTRIGVPVTEDTYNRLKELAEKNKRSMTMEAAYAIDRYIEQMQPAVVWTPGGTSA